MSSAVHLESEQFSRQVHNFQSEDSVPTNEVCTARYMLNNLTFILSNTSQHSFSQSDLLSVFLALLFLLRTSQPFKNGSHWKHNVSFQKAIHAHLNSDCDDMYEKIIRSRYLI